MALSITIDELNGRLETPVSDKRAAVLIEDAIALASFHAPCIMDENFDDAKAKQVKAVLFGAMSRWATSGGGSLSQQSNSAGPFSQSMSYDTRSPQRSGFYDNEIALIKDICGISKKKRRGRAYMLNTSPDVKYCPLYPNCDYLFGSTNSPCERCGMVYNNSYLGW